MGFKTVLVMMLLAHPARRDVHGHRTRLEYLKVLRLLLSFALLLLLAFFRLLVVDDIVHVFVKESKKQTTLLTKGSPKQR
jgi:hypothetical protein